MAGSVPVPTVAMGSLLFSDLADSPLFRSKVAELDGGLEKLKERAARLTKASKKYSGALDAAALGTAAFADSLQAFCGEATDEESSLIGGPTLLKFVATFRELGMFQDLLRTQTEVVLCERLNHEFSKVTAEVKEAKRRLDKRSSEYDAARLKHLGHRSATHLSTWAGKGSDPGKSFADLQVAKAAADEARADVARRFTQVEGAKRWEFLEGVVSAVDAHLRYFERGYQLFSGLEPYLQHALQLVEKLKGEGEAQAARMEALIAQHRAEASARDAAVGEAAAAERDAGPARPAGPLQMSAGTSQLAADLEGYIRQTQASSGQQITVLKQGYLLKQTSDFRRVWKRRFFVLDSQGILYYYSSKEGSRGEQAPRNTCSLLTATIKPDTEDPSLRFAFRVVSPDKEYHLQAENAVEQREWMEMLQGVIACLLSGAVDPTQPLPSRPARPTHSRTISSEVRELSLADAPLGSGPLGASLSARTSLTADSEQPGSALGSPPSSLPAIREAAQVAAPPPAVGAGLAARFAAAASPAAGPAAVAPAPGARPGSGGGSAAGGPLEALRRVAGNARCCDCGAADPDWASLNLGVVLCIACAGIHRRLGVHVSKVRSTTLDTAAWTPAVLDLFAQLGNEFGNEVWEGGLAAPAAGAAGAAGVNPWSASSDDDDDEQEALSAAARRRSSLEAGSSGARPGPQAPLPDKERWITAKYVDKRFLARPQGGAAAPPRLQEWLWEAVAAAYHAIACGADVNHSYSGQAAAQLVWEANLVAGGEAEQPLSPTNLGHTGALHAACRVGSVATAELLLQAGANIDGAEVMRRTPLMYALLYERADLAKHLLRRGAACTRDRHGMTPAQLAQGRECGRDGELAALLAKHA